MTRRLQISIVFAVLASIICALLLYLWDAGYKDQIAEGVTIGTVDVGGLEPAAAASQIRSNLIRPLERNVVVTYNGEDYKLKPEDINVRANVNGMVAEAVDVSQEGGIFTRTSRRISGGEVDHTVEPTISYSKKAVEEFVGGVASKIDRDPVDASVTPTAVSLDPVESQVGRSVDDAKLRKQVEKALQDPEDRKIEAEVDKLQPEVTTDQLAARYPTYLTVDRGSFKLRYFENLKLKKEYTIALGQIGYDTPGGLYHIQSKQVDPVWNVPNSDWAGDLAGETIPAGPDNPLKARWMGVNGSVGIHGTSDVGSLGSNASHGCIRMSVLDVTELYDQVATGTPIYIS